MREPDFIIGGRDNPYLKRWWIIPHNRWFNIYLHHFLRSDEDRAHHDHPWPSISIILKGKYIEHLKDGQRLRKRFRLYVRRASTAHRVELIDDQPVWTLFLTGPKVREWGFHCPNGWRHWKVFTDGVDGSRIGRGCE